MRLLQWVSMDDPLPDFDSLPQAVARAGNTSLDKMR